MVTKRQFKGIWSGVCLKESENDCNVLECKGFECLPKKNGVHKLVVVHNKGIIRGCKVYIMNWDWWIFLSLSNLFADRRV